MNKVIQVKTTVLPGGRIVIVDEDLPVGENVNVVVHHSPGSSSRSALEIIQNAPGNVLFKTPKDVETYLKEERSTWNR